MFADADLRLGSGSPCIDAGDNTAVPADITDLDGDSNTSEPIPLDLDGRLRFVDDLLMPDTGNGDAPQVDMGAYEYACIGNLDVFGGVTMSDYVIFQTHWMEINCGNCGGADFTGDGNVLMDDLLVLFTFWLCGTTP